MKSVQIITLFLLSIATLGAMDNDPDLQKDTKEKLVNHPPRRQPPGLPRKALSTSMMSKYQQEDDEINLLEDDDVQSLQEEWIKLKREELGLKREELSLKQEESILKKELVAFVKEQVKKGAAVFFEMNKKEVMLDVIPSSDKS